MAEVATTIEQLRAANQTRLTQRSVLYTVRQEIARLQRQREGMVRGGNAREVAAIDQELKRLNQAETGLVVEVGSAESNWSDAAKSWKTEVADPFAQIDERNLVMLPVRLETRFLPDANGNDELLVRIFPDDIHVIAHEPELTAEETTAGDNYWAARDANGEGEGEGEDAHEPDELTRKRAWSTIAELYGAPRASWIIKVRDPENPIDTGTRSDDWTKAAYTNVLPDRWLVAGYVGVDQTPAFAEWGNPVPDELQLGIDPLQPAPEDAVSLGQLDAGLKWVENFAEAESLGMGVRIPAAELPTANVIRLLVVVGVNSTLTPEESANRLHDLFAAHRYTDEMSFLARGTPTNNTEDAPSGFDSRDIAHEKSFAAFSMDALDEQGNGSRLAHALGLNEPQDGVFLGVENANRPDNQAAGAMQAALWPATWGYFLREMMADELEKSDIDFIHRYYIDWVRASGWLPSLRLGQQPYGFWPVTALDDWQANADDDPLYAKLSDYLDGTKRSWLNSINDVPTVGSFSNPAAYLMQVMGMNGASDRFFGRGAIDDIYALNILQYQAMNPQAGFDLDSTQYLPNLAGVIDDFADVYDFDVWDPRIRYFLFYAETFLLDGPRINYANAPAEEYIAWLLEANPDEVRLEAPYANKNMPLLYLLLRHAAWLEYGRTAYNILDQVGVVAYKHSYEPSLVDFSDEPTSTYDSILNEVHPEVTGNTRVADHMHRFKTIYRQRDHQFDKFWSGVADLNTLPGEDLDLLLRETLDLTSHRMDAWLSGLANKRFTENGAAAGIHIAGFGWVENLHKRYEPRSDGRLLAPSLDHANSAAILRAGYHAHQKQHDRDAFAVNLSSQRVRLAKEILDSAAAGLPLGAVLGYRFERMLHEHELAPDLDRYILPFRRLAPLTGDLSEDEKVAIGQVVDGYALHQKFRDGSLALPFVQSSHRNAVNNVLKELGYIIDALSDALLAEGAFQTVRSNRERTRATLDGVAHGETDPPELEFAESTQSAVAFTHRTVVALPEGSNWPTNESQIRRNAEPRLDAWLETLIPPPATLGVMAKAGTEEWPVPLTLLQQSATDLLVTANHGYEPGSEIYERFLRAAVASKPLAAGSSDIELDFSMSITDGGLSYKRLDKHLASLRQVFEDVRYTTPTDLAATDAGSAPSAWDTDDLKTRVDATEQTLRTWRAMSASDDPGVSASQRIAQLWQASAFGLHSTVPRSDDVSALRLQVAGVERQVDQIVHRLDQLAAQFDRPSANADLEVEHDLSRVQAMLGESSIVIPRFTVAAPPEFAQAVANSDAILGADSDKTLPLHNWFAKHARVQPALQKLNHALTNANRITGQDNLHLSALQFPVQENGRWVGLPLDAEDVEEYANKVSVVVLGELPQANTFAGLHIAAWTESIPKPVTDAGVAFHFDQPGARAPNAVLLATPPAAGVTWDADLALKTVVGALELAKIRMVDATALRNTGQYLPAAMLATNAADETVSTDLHRARRPNLVAAAPLMDVFLEVVEQ